LTTDRFGNANSAYFFNGSSYIAYPDVFMENINSFTFSIWFIASTFPSPDSLSQCMILYKGSLHGEASIHITGTNQLVFSAKLADGNWYGCTVNNILPNKIYHVVGRYIKGNELDIWLNDSFKGTSSIPSYNLFTSTGGTNSTIGAYSGYMAFFNSVIDDICIYNRVSSDAEIQSIYQQGGWTGN
jgi:hypothetical protein